MKIFDKNQGKKLRTLLAIGLILALPSCKDEAASTADDDKGGTVNKEKPSLLQSCKGWGSANLCLLTQEEGTGTITTPTLTFKGLDKINGNLRLFSDGDCSAVLGSPVVASVATVEITTPAQSTFTAEYYAQYTHTDNSISPCLGPVAWTVEESPNLAFESSAFSVPTFTLSELNVRAGSVGLFSDSACTVAASDPVDTDSETHRIVAHALTGYGSFEYYARHTDTAEQAGDCVGPVSYDFVSGLQETDPILALHSGNDARDDDSTPTVSLTSLEFESGTIQLFSDESCTTAASSEDDYTYSSSGTTITANALAAFGSYNYWAKITENIENQSRCMGPVAYEYVPSVQLETLTLALSSPSTSPALDSTPTLSVGGIDFRTGTVQLFSDSACTTSASSAVAASSSSVSITANALTGSSHQFYVQHTDTDGNKGNCTGPVAYSLETLALALTSPSVGWGSDDTPTFSVSGLVVQNGTVQLFSDSACSTSASGTVTVSSGTASITANTLMSGNHNFYVQHTDSSSNVGDCVGPVAYSMETLMLALTSPSVGWGSDDTPTFSVSGLVIQSGTVQLFSDSACSTAASGTVTVASGTASITANALTAGNHNFYVQHTDSNSNKGDCVGPVAYSMEILELALSSPANSPALDSTPTLIVTGLLVQNGTVQLFSDSACSTSASSTVTVSSGTASITSNSLTVGNHQLYVRHTDSNSHEGDCFGPVAYSIEILTLSPSSPSVAWGSDDTPTFNVSGLVVHNGTIQLFSDSACSTSASGTVTVSSGTASITTNALTDGVHQFYIQHTDTISNQGDCFGPANYSMETLTLALSSSNTPLDSDSTPTFDVTGLVVQNGTVRLFSDSTCTTAASGTVTVSSGTASITANALSVGSYQFYVQHTDSSSNKGNCVGPVAYRYSTETLTLTLVSPNTAIGYSLPTLSVTGLEVINGTVQLFSDDECSSSVSEAVTVDSSSISITTLPLDAGTHGFHVQHMDSIGHKGDCVGSVSYEYHEGAKEVVLGKLLSSTSRSCAILDDDSLKCWGHNTYGEVGDGSTTNRNSPVAVNLGNGRTAKNVVLGSNHTCAILDDDSLKCWGYNNGGAVGDGTTTNRNSPVAVNLGNGRTAKNVVLSSGHTCAILDDDSLKCWGHNNYGEVGIGAGSNDICTNVGNYNYSCKKTPTAVNLGDGRTVKNVVLDFSHTCVILDDDSLKCWGDNNGGEVGDGSTTNRSSPVAVNLGDGRTAKNVVLGSDHTCAILDDDSLKCWGDNNGGEVGDGSTTNRSSPVAVNLGDGRTAKNVVLGSDHTCAILDNDSLKCWGANNGGILGIGSGNNDNCVAGGVSYNCKRTPTAVDLGDDRTAKNVILDGYSCAILDDDSLKCWGNRGHGELGYGDSPVLVDLGTGRNAKTIRISNDHICAILDDQSLKCWGNNGYGQLGDGTNTIRHTPTLVDLD